MPLRLLWRSSDHHFDHHLRSSTEMRPSIESLFLRKVECPWTFLDTVPMFGGSRGREFKSRQPDNNTGGERPTSRSILGRGQYGRFEVDGRRGDAGPGRRRPRGQRGVDESHVEESADFSAPSKTKAAHRAIRRPRGLTRPRASVPGGGRSVGATQCGWRHAQRPFRRPRSAPRPMRTGSTSR